MMRQLETELRQLAFPRCTRVRIAILPIPAADSPFETDGVPVAYGAHGWDAIDFRISANPGEPPRPLGRIASGGELSRVLLAIQSLAAGRKGERTVIFDEVDSGVGAEVATVVGERLRRLAMGRQIICITHWAQVAAGADCHFRVEKSVRAGRTRVAVHRLRGEERRREIARMLGGRVTPASSLRHARELLAALSPGQGAT
jgi:DNA repair protein RecN (Recombination protein N)